MHTVDLRGSICCLVDYGALISSPHCSSTLDQSSRDAKFLKLKVKKYHRHMVNCYVFLLYVGVQILLDHQSATCKAKVLCTTLDLPAKAKVLSFTQYNGRYGCTVCKEEGMVVRVGRGSTRVYQYTDQPAPIRNHEECSRFGQMALAQNEVYNYIMHTVRRQCAL